MSLRIRKLSIKPENKKCFVCYSILPRYVCLNFGTFLCKECAGMHREFGFRTKSTVMDSFTDQELENINSQGGNDAIRKKIFKGKFSIDEPPKVQSPSDIKKYIEKVFVKLLREEKNKESEESEINEDIFEENEEWNPFND